MVCSKGIYINIYLFLYVYVHKYTYQLTSVLIQQKEGPGN